jgi:hypothetical protein
MNPSWLAQLAPAHAPPAPLWWPPAPGWWVLAWLCALLVAALTWWWREPRRARRRIALRELRGIRRAGGEIDASASAQAIENVLRRYAIAVFGRTRVARLSGAAWLQFAATHGGAGLASDSGRSLLSAAFGGAVHDQREQWLAAAEGFVRRARAPRDAA